MIIGDLDEKSEYKQMIKRVDKLPRDYNYAFKKIRKYMYTVGAPGDDMTIFTDMTMFTDLIDLFELRVSDESSAIFNRVV